MLKKELGRIKRHRRLRKKVVGNSERPRLSVHRSLNNLYAQAVDDTASKTLFAGSTLEKQFAGAGKDGGKIGSATKLGKYLGEKLIEKGIKKVAFDRGGYLYHGRIKALADAVREAGVQL